MKEFNGNEYAVMNLETIINNIDAYMSFAECKDDYKVEKAREQAEKALKRLVKRIKESNNNDF